MVWGGARAIFLGCAAKDMAIMTYALVHRNPLVTISVPKFRPEVLSPTLGTFWYCSTYGLGTLFVPKVGTYLLAS